MSVYSLQTVLIIVLDFIHDSLPDTVLFPAAFAVRAELSVTWDIE